MTAGRSTAARDTAVRVAAARSMAARSRAARALAVRSAAERFAAVHSTAGRSTAACVSRRSALRRPALWQHAPQRRVCIERQPVHFSTSLKANSTYSCIDAELTKPRRRASRPRGRAAVIYLFLLMRRDGALRHASLAVPLAPLQWEGGMERESRGSAIALRLPGCAPARSGVHVRERLRIETPSRRLRRRPTSGGEGGWTLRKEGTVLAASCLLCA